MLTTQLFFSFCPSVCDSSITQLQHSLRKISWRMAANLLTLNSSKTEFILVGLPQQLAKINTSSVITTQSPRNLVLSLINTSLSLTKYLLCLNVAIIIFVNFAVFVFILTWKLPVPSPLLSFILQLSALLYYNLPQSQIKKTPEHPELSCSCSHQNAKIFSHHSCSQISTLAENERTH